MRSSKQTQSTENLDRSLDQYWERYLHCLDQYQMLQQELSQSLSGVYDRLFELPRDNI